tara:strand:- start:7000 stop:7371 length:372 start_codon:yes stop_codon:yes gene_type:complete
MGLFDKITAKNFSAYAMKHYDDPQCEDIEDFNEDLRRFRYLKRLLHRYHDLGEMRERLMLNHIICLLNVFGFEPCMRMLNFKISEKEHWTSIKTMLLYLEYIDDTWFPDISVDMKLAERLRDM